NTNGLRWELTSGGRRTLRRARIRSQFAAWPARPADLACPGPATDTIDGTPLPPQWRHAAISRMTRHGFPAANAPAGTSRVTTLPAPMTLLDPMVTPGRTFAPPPIHTSEPIVTGLPNSRPRRSSAFIGCVAV